LAAAAGYLGSERVQVGGPGRAEVVEPGVDVAQRLRVDCVKPTGAFGAHRREPRFTQDAEVLGHRGLGDPELGADDLGDRARRLLTGGEELEDASADGIAEDVERVHGLEYIMARLYKAWMVRIVWIRPMNGAQTNICGGFMELAGTRTRALLGAIQAFATCEACVSMRLRVRSDVLGQAAQPVSVRRRSRTPSRL
jgi:hypothetical protein